MLQEEENTDWVQPMTSQKTIERCRVKVRELEEANATLLQNNTTMAESNKSLREELKRLQELMQRDQSTIECLAKEKRECKQKCEIVISEKDKLLQAKEEYIKSLHGTVWHLKNNFECKFYSFVETDKGFKLELQFHDKR